MSTDPILVITTGGTIESFYNPQDGTPSHVPLPDRAEQTCIPAALKRLGFLEGVKVQPLLMRDSNEFTPSECEQLYQTIINSPNQRILVVHGTDTMPLHAQELQTRIKALPAEHPAHGKTIVFTGAMGPLRNAEQEWRNEAMAWEILPKALEDARDLGKPGVQIEMGQGAWPATRVTKYKITENRGGREFVKSSGFRVDGINVPLSETRAR